MALTRLKPNNDDEAIDYEASGVSSKRAHEGLNRLTSQITQTWRVKEGQGRVWLELGHFANVVEIGQQGIAFCTDGVGSKSLIAQRLKKYDTIGIDCVAMNVNDLICVGATPISMVDYIAIERAEPANSRRVIDRTQARRKRGWHIGIRRRNRSAAWNHMRGERRLCI
jgi:phosphoribosylformylglycinamidine cyclo-ligase